MFKVFIFSTTKVYCISMVFENSLLTVGKRFFSKDTASPLSHHPMASSYRRSFKQALAPIKVEKKNSLSKLTLERV